MDATPPTNDDRRFELEKKRFELDERKATQEIRSRVHSPSLVDPPGCWGPSQLRPTYGKPVKPRKISVRGQ